MNISRCITVLTLTLLLPLNAAAGDVKSAIEEAIADGDLLSGVMVTRTGEDTSTFAAGVINPDNNTLPDRNTAYQIGSITKAFTNLLLAEMASRERVSYSTTVADVLGGEISFANEEVGQISLLELATHTSGLPRLPANLGATDTVDPYADFDERQLLEALASTRARQPLGSYYGYSNFGAGLLGYLLGRVHGGGYQAALQELIINPLGLDQTGFQASMPRAASFSAGQIVSPWSFDALAGAGALWSTGGDLIELSRSLVEQDQWPLDQDIQSQRTPVDAPSADFLLTPVWHAFDSEQGRVFWHNGGTAGHRSFFGFRPASDQAMVLLFSGDADPTSLALDWFGVDTSNPRNNQSEIGSIDPSILGQYQLSESIGLGIFERSGVLVAQLSGQPAARLYPVTDTADETIYALHIADASVRFIHNNGEVVAAELTQNGMIRKAEKTAAKASVVTRETVDLSPDELSAYVGEYQLAPTAVFTIRAAENGLEAQLTGQPFLAIFPKGDDVFFYKAVDAELHFQRNDQGSVTALVLHQGGRELAAEKL